MRLGDLDALKEAIADAYPRFHQRIEIKDVFEAIKNAPTIDAEPVRHGRWEHDGSRWKNRWVCSGCGYKWFFDTARGMYCPNCGAKMDLLEDSK